MINKIVMINSSTFLTIFYSMFIIISPVLISLIGSETLQHDGKVIPMKGPLTMVVIHNKLITMTIFLEFIVNLEMMIMVSISLKKVDYMVGYFT